MDKLLRIGIDVGGTKVLAAEILEGKVIRHIQEPVDAQNLVPQLIRLVKQLNPPASIGVGIAGQIKNGVVLSSHNLKLFNLPLKAELEGVFKVPVQVINDVQAAGWTEWQLGAGKNCNNLLVVFLGTGIGAALIVNGKLLEGTVGEIGHMIIHKGGLPCTCGQKGCLEPYAAGWGLAKRTQKTSAEALIDPEDRPIVQEGFFALACALSNLANLLNPDKIVIGGGLVKAYERFYPNFLPDLETQIQSQSLTGSHHKIPLVRATLDTFAIAIGSVQ